MHPIYSFHKFLDNEEIEKIIEYTKNLPTEVGTVGLKGNKKKISFDYHIKNLNIGNLSNKRITDVKWIFRNSNTNWIYEKICRQIYKINQENFNFILNYLEDLQFLEYSANKNAFFSRHIDCHTDSLHKNNIDIRKLSFSIQLTEENEYEGGELIFYIDGCYKVAPKTKGTITFFKSNILHEVKPVTKGNRHSIVGWIHGPNLK